MKKNYILVDDIHTRFTTASVEGMKRLQNPNPENPKNHPAFYAKMALGAI